MIFSEIGMLPDGEKEAVGSEVDMCQSFERSAESDSEDEEEEETTDVTAFATDENMLLADGRKPFAVECVRTGRLGGMDGRVEGRIWNGRWTSFSSLGF